MLALLAHSPAAFIAVALVLGLIVGSFLNVVIYRLPLMLERQWRAECAEWAASGAATALTSAQAEGEVPPASGEPRFNLVVPRSACPACKAPIKAIHNIPLLSYLALRGRCASCRAHISARYPLVELLTGVLTALVGLEIRLRRRGRLRHADHLVSDRAHLHRPRPSAAARRADAAAAVARTARELERLGHPGQSLPVDSGQRNRRGRDRLSFALAVYQGFRLLTGKEGMGYGDFKLLAALGAWLG